MDTALRAPSVSPFRRGSLTDTAASPRLLSARSRPQKIPSARILITEDPLPIRASRIPARLSRRQTAPVLITRTRRTSTAPAARSLPGSLLPSGNGTRKRRRRPFSPALISAPMPCTGCHSQCGSPIRRSTAAAARSTSILFRAIIAAAVILFLSVSPCISPRRLRQTPGRSGTRDGEIRP